LDGLLDGLSDGAKLGVEVEAMTLGNADAEEGDVELTFGGIDEAAEGTRMTSGSG
jgi:hypothetical protein